MFSIGVYCTPTELHATLEDNPQYDASNQLCQAAVAAVEAIVGSEANKDAQAFHIVASGEATEGRVYVDVTPIPAHAIPPPPPVEEVPVEEEVEEEAEPDES